MSSRTRPRFNAAKALPWLLAAGSWTFGCVVWLTSPTGASSGANGAASQPLDDKELARSLQTIRVENEGLRRELDRLSSLLRTEGRIDRAGSPASPNADGDLRRISDGDLEDRVSLLKEQLARSAAGDAGAQRDVAQAVSDMLRSGPKAFSALRDLYLAADPQGRKLLLESMAPSGSGLVKGLILEQVKTEKDPEVRQALLTNATRYANWQDLNAGLTSTFIQSIDAPGEDPAIREAAIRGLRNAPGSAAPDALMRAARDPSEEVRIAAIDVIASRPGGEQSLQQLMSSDASPHVREFAQCRLLVAKTLR